MDLTHITGYRSNEDHTETLAWLPNASGLVGCVHEEGDDYCCVPCFEADRRLFRNLDGDTVVGHWPANAVRDGQTVTFN